MSDFNVKMQQIRFWLGLRPRPPAKTYSAPLTPKLVGGGLAAPPLIGATWAHNVMKRRNTFLLGYTVPQNAHSFVHRRSSSHRTLCFTAISTTSWITGTL